MIKCDICGKEIVIENADKPDKYVYMTEGFNTSIRTWRNEACMNEANTEWNKEKEAESPKLQAYQDAVKTRIDNFKIAKAQEISK